MRIDKTTLSLFCVVLIISICIAFAESGVGTNAGNFLKIGSGARAIGLGETFVSISDDPSALYWNPAGLTQSERPKVLFSYNRWLEDLSHGFVGVNSKPYDWGIFGVGITYLSLSDMDAYDEYDKIIGKTNAHDLAAMFAYARDFTINGYPVAFGVSYKYLNQKLDDSTAGAHAIDLGILSHFLDGRLHVGLAIQNLVSSKIRFYVAEANLERVLRFGVSYTKDILGGRDFLVSTQLDLDENRMRFGIGTELEVYDPFVIRIGYRQRDIGTGISAGFGVVIHEINIDYALSNYEEFDYTHMVTISMALENFKLKKKKEFNYE
ncbi:MAG: PorV/PorQ family protein [Elusimicrobiota bacterium]